MTVGLEIADTASVPRTGDDAPRPAKPLSPLARIDLQRIMLILALVVLHAKPLVDKTAPLSALTFLGRLLQEGPLRAAVPLLSAVSGYLLFRSKLDTRPLDLVRKKSRTLLLPLVLWNLPLAAITCWAQAHGKFLEQRLVLGGPGASVGAWLEALFGLTSDPIDFPLHFIRDLYVLSLLTLVIGPLLRRSPIATFLGVHVVFMLFDWDGNLVRRIEMAPMFFAGGVLAVMGANLRAFDAYWKPMLALFALTSVAVAIDGDHTKLGFLRILGVMSLWPAFGAMMHTRAGQWLAARSHFSFWLYATHGPLLELMHKFWKPSALGVPDEAYWLVGPVLATTLSVIAYKAASAVAPGFVALATGGRGDAVQRDATRAPQPA